jgi:hypothetical protein
MLGVPKYTVNTEPGNTRGCEILCGPGKSSGWLASDERAQRWKLGGAALMAGWRWLAPGEGGLVGRVRVSRGTGRLYSRLPLHRSQREQGKGDPGTAAWRALAGGRHGGDPARRRARG